MLTEVPGKVPDNRSPSRDRFELRRTRALKQFDEYLHSFRSWAPGIQQNTGSTVRHLRKVWTVKDVMLTATSKEYGEWAGTAFGVDVPEGVLWLSYGDWHLWRGTGRAKDQTAVHAAEGVQVDDDKGTPVVHPHWSCLGHRQTAPQAGPVAGIQNGGTCYSPRGATFSTSQFTTSPLGHPDPGSLSALAYSGHVTQHVPASQTGTRRASPRTPGVQLSHSIPLDYRRPRRPRTPSATPSAARASARLSKAFRMRLARSSRKSTAGSQVFSNSGYPRHFTK